MEGVNTDTDTDTTPEEIVTVTLHPDCESEVDKEFDCPWHSRSSVKGLLTLSTTELASYAYAGCPACILMYTAIQHIAPELLKSWNQIVCSDSPLGYFVIVPEASSLKIDICFAWETKVNHLGHVPRYRFYDQQFGAENTTTRHVPGDTSSAKSMSFARRCIQKCNNEHACLKKQSLAYMPTRLPDTRDDIVRLVETSDTHVTADYACLSHCWGKQSTGMLRTTSSNLQTFKRCIPWIDIPLTFQDAIIVARRLGISFLWIDALCIIQDDSLDWQHQSAVMADIYENAYITIAAATSVDTNSGCFTSKIEMDVTQVHKPLATVKFGDGTTRNMYATKRLKHRVGDFPLLSRGWVYQERLLSPRVLYFAGKELIWECRESLDCECHEPGCVQIARVDPRQYQQDRDFRSWIHVLEEYTDSSLTYASDAFPALSGIVKAYQKFYNDTYVAGMWMKCLPDILLWYFETESDVLNINTHTWRAPSWSWASQNWHGSLIHLHCKQSIAKVHSVLCEPSGADPTGELAFAHLTLTAHLVSACLKRQGTEDALSYLIEISNGHQIVRTEIRHIYSMTNYFGLSDPRLAVGIPYLGIIIAQIGSTVQEVGLRKVFGIEGPIIRRDTSFLLLAKHPDNTERWLRIGVLVIMDIDEHLAIADVNAQGEYKVGQWDKFDEKPSKKLKAALVKRTLQARDTFRLFDEAPMQNITIW